jgi:hypothetical protein
MIVQLVNHANIILAYLISKPLLARLGALMAITHFKIVKYVNHVVNGV